MRHCREEFGQSNHSRQGFDRWVRTVLLGVVSVVVLLGCSDGESTASTVAVEETVSPPPSSAASAVPEVSPAPQSGSIWATRAPLLDPNSETAVAQLDGRIYVIGGYPSTRVYVNTVQVYDAQTDQWSYTTPVPQPLHHTMAAAVNGKLYVIGGEISMSGVANQGIFIANVYEYDPATATWTEKTPMPTARSAGATGVIDGKIYVAGGRPPRGHDFAVYDASADTWTVLPNLPTQRNHLAAGAIDGLLYVVGGRFGGGVGSEMTDIVEVYDPASGNWRRAASLPAARGGVNGIATRGCFYVFGGEGNDADPRGVFAELDVYDPRTDMWQNLEPIPTPVHGVTGAAVFDDWVHLPGGGTARGGNSGSTLHQAFRAEVDCR
ncbi:MAG: Kelch repeat-containing protein [Dehalococcoidia bacterium]